jgi:hypothetical protein
MTVIGDSRPKSSRRPECIPFHVAPPSFLFFEPFTHSRDMNANSCQVLLPSRGYLSIPLEGIAEAAESPPLKALNDRAHRPRLWLSNGLCLGIAMEVNAWRYRAKLREGLLRGLEHQSFEKGISSYRLDGMEAEGRKEYARFWRAISSSQ